MNSIIPLILQFAGTAVAVLTFYWRIQKSHNEKQASQIEKIRSDYEKEIECLQARIDSWESQRKSDVRALHKRIDEQDDFVKKSIIGQLSRMEGEMKGMSNILRIIQEHFVRTGAGKR